jgi:hypothetical protein
VASTWASRRNVRHLLERTQQVPPQGITVENALRKHARHLVRAND